MKTSTKADLIPLLTQQHFDEAMSHERQGQHDASTELANFILEQTVERTVAKLEGKLEDLGALMTTQMPDSGVSTNLVTEACSKAEKSGVDTDILIEQSSKATASRQPNRGLKCG